MLQAFIVTLREGVEAALIVGIVLAYLQKIGRTDLRKTVFAALGSAFVASLGVAFVLSRTQFNQDIFEGWVMLVAAVFVVSMIIFMARTARTLKGEIETKIGKLASGGSGLGVFLFVFLMVLREGVETVLILSGVTLNSSELMSFMGTLAGVVAAIVFGVMFVKGSVRINLGRFFKVTSVILYFVAFQLVISGLHELSENGVLPSSQREMAWIGPIVRNDLFFFITILALAALMILFEYKRRSSLPQPTTESKAAQRKAEWAARRERLWMSSVYVACFVFIFLVTAQVIYAHSTTVLSPAVPVELNTGFASVPLSQVEDGDLHRYVVTLNGHPVRFLVLKKPDGKVATALDACQICGMVGFYKTGSSIICKNCSSPINAQSVGQPGGCNPIPLPAQISGDQIKIATSDLIDAVAHIK